MTCQRMIRRWGERERQRRREEYNAAVWAALFTALVIGMLFQLTAGGHAGGHRRATDHPEVMADNELFRPWVSGPSWLLWKPSRPVSPGDDRGAGQCILGAAPRP